jgi:hypothetical protein
MFHSPSRPINVVTVPGGGATVVSLTVTGKHQDHPPRPSVGNLSTHWQGSTNAPLVTVPGVLAAQPKVTVARGNSTALTQGPHPPRLVQASGRAYNAPRSSSQPSVTVASSRSSAPTFSRPPTTTPSAYPPSRPPRPHPLPRSQPTPLSNPSYRGSSSDNQDRTDSRGFHYAERTNARPQVCHAREFAKPRVAPGTLPVVADRRGRYLVGAEYIAGGAPMARKYLDAAWGVTPGTKKSLGLTE